MYKSKGKIAPNKMRHAKQYFITYTVPTIGILCSLLILLGIRLKNLITATLYGTVTKLTFVTRYVIHDDDHHHGKGTDSLKSIKATVKDAQLC